MKRILITGVCGLSGRYLFRQLSGKGFNLQGLYHRHYTLPKKYKAHCRAVGLTDDKAVHDAINEFRPHALFHLAAQSLPRLSWQFPEQTHRVNVQGTLNLLRACRRYVPNVRFIFASSNQVYGFRFRDGHHCSETELVWPENPYAASKAEAEYACLDFANRYGMKIMIARPFNHIGLGLHKGLVFSDWCRQISEAEQGLQEPLLRVGNLDTLREFLHAEDIARGYETLLKKGRNGEIYNICTGKVKPIGDYVDFLKSAARVAIRVISEKARFRREDPQVMRGGCLRKCMDWGGVLTRMEWGRLLKF